MSKLISSDVNVAITWNDSNKKVIAGFSDKDDFHLQYENKLQSELIKSLDSQNQHNIYPNDFLAKEEPRIQPTNPHFAKENWRKK